MLTAHCIPSSYLINPFSTQTISYAFHDIDGTHSLIREWAPVMSVLLADVITYGLPDNLESEENCTRLINLAGKKPFPETDRFCEESAGLSALTQMEWAIRRAIEERQITISCDMFVNSQKIQRIWNGEEISDDLPETPEMQQFLSVNAPRLFRLYERILNGYCRNHNLAVAAHSPELYRVPGSLAFLEYLKQNGVKNYFVTGAVVEKGKGMFQEIETLGYTIGNGCLAEDIIGSTWDEKLPKNVIMNRLLQTLAISGDQVLIVGDGRAEISAGVSMGAVTVSRLPKTSLYQRSLHQKLGTNLIFPDYTDPILYKYFQRKE